MNRHNHRLIGILAFLLVSAAVTGLYVVGQRMKGTASQEVVPSFVRDDQGASTMLKVTKSLGYQTESFTGVNWRGEGCLDHSYIVMMTKQPSLLFTRNITTGDIQSVPVADAERQLHRYISFDGSLVGVRLSPDGINEYWWIGVVPDEKDRRDVYIHFDKGACGFVVDKVWYRGPSGNDQTIPVSIRLEPVPGWKLN